jgi:multiple sugar transport system substrate-binding protein
MATMHKLAALAAAFLATGGALAGAASAQQAKRFDGVALSLASMNDQFSGVLVKLAPRAKEELGLDVNVEILSYPELLTKITADFVGETRGYDLVTMDIVWAGQFAEAGHTVPLNERIERDKAELGLDDIYPVLMTSLGQYEGSQVAYPFAGYANVLAYRTDLYEAAGLQPPRTMDELIAAAKRLTDKAKDQYGFVANGQKGPAVAQDWMQYNAQLGGSILGPDGRPAINSEANVASLRVYKELFDEAAPPGAVEFDWGGREESFRQGLVANMQTWSVGAAGYDDPLMSKVVGKAGIVLAPVKEGMAPTYGVGGWGLGINADIEEAKQEAAWAYVKWATSPAVQKELNLLGASSYLRKSTLKDPELLAKYPYLPVIAESFEKGNGEYRPRIPQYPEIQDMLGDAVNAVLVGGKDPKAALDEAQAKAEALF